MGQRKKKKKTPQKRNRHSLLQPSLFEKAFKCHQQGRVEEACALYEKIIEKDPKHHQALHFLGVIHLQRNQLHKAVDLIRQAITLNNRMPEYHTNLSIALNHLGQSQAAINACQEALALAPGFAEAYINIGNALKHQGDLTTALDYYRKTLEIKPEYTAAYYNIGNVLDQLGKQQEAIRFYQKAIAIRSDYLAAHINLANTYNQIGAFHEAIEACHKATLLNPGSPEPYIIMGTAFHEIGRPHEALVNLNKAISITKTHPTAFINLGNILLSIGKTEEARSAYQKALELDPTHLEGLGNMAGLLEKDQHYTEAKKVVQKGLALAPNHKQFNLIAAKIEHQTGQVREALMRLKGLAEETPHKVNIGTYFELGAIYERLNETDQAFYHFKTANRLMSQRTTARLWDKDILLRSIEAASLNLLQSIGEFSQGTLASTTAPHRLPPVFIVGFPYSENPQLLDLLKAHPDLHVLKDMPLVNGLTDAVFQLPKGYPKGVPYLTSEQIEHLRNLYDNNIKALVPMAKQPALVIDHLPLNLMHCELILRVFPEAKFIFTVRHPLDACLNCFMQPLPPTGVNGHFMSLPDTAELYAALMSLWQQYTDLLPIKFHQIRYEDFAADWVEEKRRLFTFLDIPDSGAQLTGLHTEDRSMGRWIRYENELEPIMEILTPFIAAYGYAPDSKKVASL